jgi:hypothetical protein
MMRAEHPKQKARDTEEKQVAENVRGVDAIIRFSCGDCGHDG